MSIFDKQTDSFHSSSMDPTVQPEVGYVHQESVGEKVRAFFGKFRVAFSVMGALLLFGGLAGGVYLSQQQTQIQQHASANYMPPDGFGIYESCAPYASWCFTNLDTFAQGGMKLVLNYTVFQGNTTLTDVTNYAARAQQDNIKIIWSLKDLWAGSSTDLHLFPELAKESGCTTKSCLAAWLTNRVKDFPATWGYYIADEPTSSAYSAVASLSSAVHTADPNHPRLIVKLDVLENGNASNIVNLSQFAPIADVLGEDWYPVAYGQNLTNTGTIANEVQYIAGTVNHKDSTMVLEVNAGNSSDGVHATAYPTQTQMAEMLTLVLQHSQPRMVLWYWYPGASSSQWNNLVNAIRSVTSSSAPTVTQPIQTNQPIASPTSPASNQPVCTGTRSGGGSDQYDDANGPYVNCAKVSSCTGTTCSVTLSWQETNRATANEYKMVLYPVRPGKTGSYELLTFNNTTTATLTGFKQDTPYVIKVSAWPNGVFRQGYGSPYYRFTASSQNVGPTDSISPTTSPSESPTPSGTQLQGDLNGDGVVNILDYNMFINCYGDKAGSSACPDASMADINKDGVVDGVDYNILLRAMVAQQ